jgi:regulator of cell morphogenesis and NO signaling
MQDLANKTIAQIVTDHYQTARVFENYGLDFCCRGKRPLAAACQEKDIAVEHVLDDLYKLLKTDDTRSDFNTMSLTELAEYIVRVHHNYVKQQMPQIFNYVLRVASKHGDRYPFMSQVHALFNELTAELTEHMEKEEKILFPRIKLLELNAAEHPDGHYLQAPIQLMEQEHDHAGTIMLKIRELTNNYAAPEQACTTFRLALESLKAFEQDLHQHVHLENNILFPKAIHLSASPACCSLRK